MYDAEEIDPEEFNNDFEQITDNFKVKNWKGKKLFLRVRDPEDERKYDEFYIDLEKLTEEEEEEKLDELDKFLKKLEEKEFPKEIRREYIKKFFEKECMEGSEADDVFEEEEE